MTNTNNPYAISSTQKKFNVALCFLTMAVGAFLIYSEIYVLGGIAFCLAVSGILALKENRFFIVLHAFSFLLLAVYSVYDILDTLITDLENNEPAAVIALDSISVLGTFGYLISFSLYMKYTWQRYKYLGQQEPKLTP